MLSTHFLFLILSHVECIWDSAVGIRRCFSFQLEFTLHYRSGCVDRSGTRRGPCGPSSLFNSLAWLFAKYPHEIPCVVERRSGIFFGFTLEFIHLCSFYLGEGSVLKFRWLILYGIDYRPTGQAIIGKSPYPCKRDNWAIPVILRFSEVT